MNFLGGGNFFFFFSHRCGGPFGIRFLNILQSCFFPYILVSLIDYLIKYKMQMQVGSI